MTSVRGVARAAVVGAMVMLFAGIATAGQITIPQDGLLGYWTGDGDAQDHSGSGNDGTFWGNGTYTPGVDGQAFLFSHYSGVDIPNRAYWRMDNDSSYAFWVRVDQPSVWDAEWTFLGQDAGPGTGVPKWVVMGRPTFLYMHTNGYGADFAVPMDLQVGVWYHLAIVKQGNEFAVYQNGAVCGTSISSTPLPVVNAPLRLGYGEEILQLNGAMDDIVFYDRALTPSEVEGLAGVPEPATLALLAAGAAALVARRRGGRRGA